MSLNSPIYSKYCVCLSKDSPDNINFADIPIMGLFKINEAVRLKISKDSYILFAGENRNRALIKNSCALPTEDIKIMGILDLKSL